jgi:Cdc6-like AAA superfamily ATPase
MRLFDSRTTESHDLPEKHIYPAARSNSDRIISQLRTQPLHSKLVLCACIRLFSNDNEAKITVTDVFAKYKQLTARFNINWLSLSKVTEYIKELEMLGFLKCTYPQKGHAHQIRYIHIFEPAEIPRYISVLQEELAKERINS